MNLEKVKEYESIVLETIDIEQLKLYIEVGETLRPEHDCETLRTLQKYGL